jgi:hypothetical protein
MLILPPSMPCVLPPPLKFQRRRKSVHATVADESGRNDAHQDYVVENWVDETPAGNYRRRYNRLTGYSTLRQHKRMAMQTVQLLRRAQKIVKKWTPKATNTKASAELAPSPAPRSFQYRAPVARI